MRIAKKMMLIILLLILVLILLDFIPVKFAVRISNSTKPPNVFVCEVDMKTPMHPPNMWIAEKENNTSIENDYAIFLLPNRDPHEILNRLFFDKYTMFSKAQNRFLFKGELKDVFETDNLYWAEIDLLEWDILYPIERLSFRSVYVPKGYLTIYDYDWGVLLKKITDNKSDK